MKNANQTLEKIAFLIKNDIMGMRFGKKLNVKKLDFTIGSLKEIDNFLEFVKKEKSKLKEEELEKIILRTGAYLGEVIRKQDQKRFLWVSYDEACKVKDSLKDYGKSLLTGFLIYDARKKSFLFALNKPYKYLETGKEDSLFTFAKAVLGGEI